MEEFTGDWFSTERVQPYLSDCLSLNSIDEKDDNGRTIVVEADVIPINSKYRQRYEETLTETSTFNVDSIQEIDNNDKQLNNYEINLEKCLDLNHSREAIGKELKVPSVHSSLEEIADVNPKIKDFPSHLRTTHRDVQNIARSEVGRRAIRKVGRRSSIVTCKPTNEKAQNNMGTMCSYYSSPYNGIYANTEIVEQKAHTQIVTGKNDSFFDLKNLQVSEEDTTFADGKKIKNQRQVFSKIKHRLAGFFQCSKFWRGTIINKVRSLRGNNIMSCIKSKSSSKEAVDGIGGNKVEKKTRDYCDNSWLLHRNFYAWDVMTFPDMQTYQLIMNFNKKKLLSKNIHSDKIQALSNKCIAISNELLSNNADDKIKDYSIQIKNSIFSENSNQRPDEAEQTLQQDLFQNKTALLKLIAKNLPVLNTKQRELHTRLCKSSNENVIECSSFILAYLEERAKLKQKTTGSECFICGFSQEEQLIRISNEGIETLSVTLEIDNLLDFSRLQENVRYTCKKCCRALKVFQSMWKCIDPKNKIVNNECGSGNFIDKSKVVNEFHEKKKCKIQELPKENHGTLEETVKNVSGKRFPDDSALEQLHDPTSRYENRLDDYFEESEKYSTSFGSDLQEQPKQCYKQGYKVEGYIQKNLRSWPGYDSVYLNHAVSTTSGFCRERVPTPEIAGNLKNDRVVYKKRPQRLTNDVNKPFSGTRFALAKLAHKRNSSTV